MTVAPEEIVTALARKGYDDAARFVGNLIGMDSRDLVNVIYEGREYHRQEIEAARLRREFERRLAKWHHNHGHFPNSSNCPRDGKYAHEHTVEGRALTAQRAAEGNEYAQSDLARICDVVVEMVEGESFEHVNPETGYKEVHALYRVVSGDNTIIEPTFEEFLAHEARREAEDQARAARGGNHA